MIYTNTEKFCAWAGRVQPKHCNGTFPRTDASQLGKLCCIGCILRGYIAIITKLSPPFPVCDVVLVPGLLPIFLHGCKIKSGSGLGTRQQNSYTHMQESITEYVHRQWIFGTLCASPVLTTLQKRSPNLLYEMSWSCPSSLVDTL